MTSPTPAIPTDCEFTELADHAYRLAAELSRLESSATSLAHAATEAAIQNAGGGRSLAAAAGLDRVDIFHGYFWVVVISFVVTLIATPIMRRLAIAHGVVDHPSDPRKVHRIPIAYLGGVAVFLGLLAGILYSYIAAGYPGLLEFHPTRHLSERNDFMHAPVPLSILLGITIIMLVGLLDDVVGIPPWQKVGGQLFAAAALAYDDVGVKVAAGLVLPVANLLGIDAVTIADVQTIGFTVQIPGFVPGIGGSVIFLDMVYWIGTAIIAVFVLGACNASNLIDGLDGLLSGTTAIAAAGLLVVALGMALADDGPRDAQRIVLCLALLGACLGFLPHNFNPATIFLGDCGSLLLGFTTIVIILTLGDTGKTYLVAAGLFIYAVPIIDTILAIVRRKLSGKSISAADDQHLHHMLKRSLGVKGAVLTLYAIGAGCALIGIGMTLGRARVAYAVALIFASFIVVTAIKIARRAAIEEHAREAIAARMAAKAGDGDSTRSGRPRPQPKPLPANGSGPTSPVSDAN